MNFSATINDGLDIPAKPRGSNTNDDDTNQGRHSNDHHENNHYRSHTVIGMLQTNVHDKLL